MVQDSPMTNRRLVAEAVARRRAGARSKAIPVAGGCAGVFRQRSEAPARLPRTHPCLPNGADATMPDRPLAQGLMKFESGRDLSHRLVVLALRLVLARYL